MECRERLETYLRDQQVPFAVHRHPIAFTAQEIAAAEHIPGKLIAKVVMAVADGRMVMLVLLGHHQVDLDRAAAALGAREFRLAGEREFGPLFPDCDTGSMPPFGHFYNVPVYVDRAVTEAEQIFFQAGRHTETISLAYADFERLERPQVLDFSDRPLTRSGH